MESKGRRRRIQLSFFLLALLTLTCGSETLIAQGSLTSTNRTEATADPCIDPSTHSAVKDALRIVCSRENAPAADRSVQPAIVIGFVGGFVKPNDVKHPEVAFANYLRSRYGSTVRVAIFGNREGKLALQLIREQIEAGKNGSMAPTQRATPKIILYGHSWGASEVLEFSRELERQGIPVALTIQIDSVHKMGQNDRIVPANVAKAVNFYQRKGLTPGRPLILPADVNRTEILGNFHLTYKHHDIRCNNYHWLSRVLNKPHHQIENDPLIWDRIATLIDSELSGQDNARSVVFAQRDGHR